MCRSAIGLLLLLTILAAADAQELEPRAFAANPIGANFLIGAFTRTAGDVLVDPSLPFADVEATVRSYAAGYGRSFGLADRVASIAVVASHVELDASGEVFEETRAVSRSGPADLRLRFTYSLLSGTAVDAATFARNPPDTTLGASLVIVAPTGRYRSDTLVNIGANRWALKPEVGGSHRIGRWTVEGSVGVWLYSDNEAFFGGGIREQDPIGTLQVHVSYTFRPRLWLAASGTWYTGGRTSVDGERKNDLQRNTRAGLTLAWPLSTSHTLKLGWNTGTSTRIGGDFDTWSLAYQYLWFD